MKEDEQEGELEEEDNHPATVAEKCPELADGHDENLFTTETRRHGELQS